MKKMSIRGEWFKEWEVFLDVYEADKIINAPIAKHHSLSRVTLGMKNWLGAIGGLTPKKLQCSSLAAVE